MRAPGSSSDEGEGDGASSSDNDVDADNHVVRSPMHGYVLVGRHK